MATTMVTATTQRSRPFGMMIRWWKQYLCLCAKMRLMKIIIAQIFSYSEQLHIHRHTLTLTHAHLSLQSAPFWCQTRAIENWTFCFWKCTFSRGRGKREPVWELFAELQTSLTQWHIVVVAKPFRIFGSNVWTSEHNSSLVSGVAVFICYMYNNHNHNHNECEGFSIENYGWLSNALPLELWLQSASQRSKRVLELHFTSKCAQSYALANACSLHLCCAIRFTTFRSLHLITQIY